MIQRKNNEIEKCEKAKIKFGVMCSYDVLQAWQINCIKEILELDGVQLSLLVKEDTFQSVQSKTPAITQTVYSKYFLFHRYQNSIFKSKAKEIVDFKEIVKNTQTINCNVIKTNTSDQFFSKEDIQKIKECNLDFILRFGFSNISGDILNVTKYGVWSYRHNEKEYRGGPPFFWEVYRENPVTEVVLQKLTDKSQGGIILKRGYFKTSRSYSSNFNGILNASTKWPALVVKDILNGNAHYLESSPITLGTQIYTYPTNLQMFYYFFKLFKRYFIYKFKNQFMMDQWNIGFINESIQTFIERCETPEIIWLPQKKKMFLADPFAIEKENHLYIFCEVFDYRTLKGEIATFCYNRNNSDIDLKKLDLDVSCHLSYPYLFEFENNIYLIPESSEVEKIILYRAIDFPEKWERVSTILENVKAVDSTIFQYQGMWWLAYSDMSIGRHNNLCFLYALNPLGEWKVHELNPVKIDIRSSRSAGTPFINNGILYRPSQDCSEKYGGKIGINKVNKLTPFEFEEETVKIIEPSKTGPYPEGRHTISTVGNNTIIDGHRSIFTCRSIFKRN